MVSVRDIRFSGVLIFISTRVLPVLSTTLSPVLAALSAVIHSDYPGVLVLCWLSVQKKIILVSSNEMTVFDGHVSLGFTHFSYRIAVPLYHLLLIYKD